MGARRLLGSVLNHLRQGLVYIQLDDLLQGSGRRRELVEVFLVVGKQGRSVLLGRQFFGPASCVSESLHRGRGIQLVVLGVQGEGNCLRHRRRGTAGTRVTMSDECRLHRGANALLPVVAIEHAQGYAAAGRTRSRSVDS